MIKKFYDTRLPKHYFVSRNDFDEYVVCDMLGRVAKVYQGSEYSNVRASRTKEGAVNNYLNGKISKGMVE